MTEPILSPAHNLRGLGTALITPFKASSEVDYHALENLIQQQIDGGVDYLVVLGTTGEAVTLTHAEQEAVRLFIATCVAGRLPLVLGLGGNCTQEVCDRIRALTPELKRHYTAILSVCPFYNKPSQEGLFRHFTALAEVSPVPIILYNVPGRTGVNLLPETVMRLQQTQPDRIIGIKEASGNLDQIRELLRLRHEAKAEKQFLVISGDDGIACQLMADGADGLISVASNAWPEDFGRIVREKDAAMQASYQQMITLLFKEGNPAGIKTVLSQRGTIANVLRLPLVPCSTNLQEVIRATVTEL